MNPDTYIRLKEIVHTLNEKELDKLIAYALSLQSMTVPDSSK